MMSPASFHDDPSFDQAAGLRRLFGTRRTRFLALVQNPFVDSSELVIERLCDAALALGLHTLVVDAADGAPAPREMALLDLAACIEPLADEVSYLAARGLPIRHVDSRGRCGAFLDAIERAVPQADMVIVHAGTSDVARLFAARPLRPMLLGGDSPRCMTEAYAALKRLAQRPEFAGQVRVFAEWDAVPAIVNAARSGLPVSLPPDYEAEHDPQVMAAVREVLTDLPRVTWINLGDTDTHAHAGRYSDYLVAASAADGFLSELWMAIEANPRTAGRTTLIVTTDHGRGAATRNRWRGHGSGRWRGINVAGLRHVGSDAVWIAARGPGIRSGAYGMEDCATISQVAATMLRSIDLLEAEGQPDMAPPLDVFATVR